MNLQKITKLLGAAAALCAVGDLLFACRDGQQTMKDLKQFKYAHRGLHNKPSIPENSMAAFRLAIENGYGAELDVHLMKDGRLAVIHDSSLKRTAGVDLKIEDLTAEDLPDYPLEESTETIPLFEDVLELFQDKTPLIVELKTDHNNYAELTQAATQLLDSYRVSYCMESFDPRCIRWLKENRPDIIRGQLSTDFSPKNMRQKNTPVSTQLIMLAVRYLLTNLTGRPDFIAYDHTKRQLPILKLCRRLYHVQEVSWTVRTPEEAEKLLQDDCIVIFENFWA